MVDCRTCKHCYKIWEEFCETNGKPYQIVCMKKKIFVDWKFAISGWCEEYDDMDGNDSA